MAELAYFFAQEQKYGLLLRVLQESKEPMSSDLFAFLFDVDRYVHQNLNDKIRWDVVISCYILLTQKFMLKPTMESLVALFESVYFLRHCEWDPKFHITDSQDFVRKLLAYFSIEELNADFTFPCDYQNLAHCIACQMPDYLLLFQGFQCDIFIRVQGKNLLEYAVRSLYVSMDTMEQLYLSGLDVEPTLQKFMEDEQLEVQIRRFKSLRI